jgi:16S rRNA (guanine527-N7)-methyltransferase
MDEAIWLRSICRKNQFNLSDEQVDLLQKYVAQLLGWNKKLNLVSRRDAENIWTRHILISIAPLFRFEFRPGSAIIDIGTGGGLPGIPIAILSTHVKMTLVDSIQKKVRAVSEIVSTLKLAGVKTHCGRAEDINHLPKYHRSFDYVIARGVASITQMMEWSVPFLRGHSLAELNGSPAKPAINPGSILLWKGGDLTSELAQAELKLKPAEISSYPLIIEGIDPSELADKKIVVIRP